MLATGKGLGEKNSYLDNLHGSSMNEFQQAVIFVYCEYRVALAS